MARRGLRFPDSTKPLSFREFVGKVSPRFRWYKHAEVLADVLQRVADGEIRRLMVFMPPRHGKSEQVSRLFTAYWLYRFPEQWVGLNSYGAELAYTLSRAARDNYQRAGGRVRDDAAAVKHWETGQGGGMWAAGVGGPITGKGWHLGVIDDPVKNAQEAASPAILAAQREWYESTFYTREEPIGTSGGGAIVLIQTRWNEADLAGYLMTKEADSEEPERWHVVLLDAIHEDTPLDLPVTCTVEPDWRQVGEALCPERRSVHKLKKIAAVIGSYFWASLFQQRPRPREGKMFREDWFSVIRRDDLPVFVEFVRRWDLAATEDRPGADPDWTAGALMGKSEGGEFVILDIKRLRGSPAQVEALLRSTAEQDREYWGHVPIEIEREPGSNSLIAARYLITRVLVGFDVRCEPSTGSKVERARVLASQAEVGNVKLLSGPWNRDFVEELAWFPTPGVHDDQVDAASGAIGLLCETYSAGAF